MGSLDCDALHLDEPCGTADGGEGDDVGDVGEFFLEHILDHLVVGSVAKIDDDLHDIAPIHAAFFEQFFYVLPHAACLAFDVAHVEDFTLVVDGGGA